MNTQHEQRVTRLDSGAIEHQVVKGIGILLLCLERGRSLSMKGFIDSQIEMGAPYVPVVERMATHIDSRLKNASSREQRALLLDLHNYADAQLRAAHAIWEKPPGEE
ncbi:MAG: hypothetical protein JST22_01915 [Bacteroidetes bacterium]|nr:hypothetical protein [Bacteroidota bacterium]